MENNQGYKKLNVYQKANGLVLVVYKTTSTFPKEELFGLISQMRRCAVSVPANIVEGYGRRTKKDKLQFLYIARGSLNELEYYIELVLQLGYIAKSEYEELTVLRSEVGRLLFGFIRLFEK
ncbi:MAG: four helix bundle protein [Candidatus Liptonbacteria bacterium]|nr:four helix bundle protein [Candidatus Liptonbacteria bacterium]